jgi:hypothetical protein
MTWITARWRHFWTDAELIVRPDDEIDPFNKSMALNACVADATGDVLALVDADTWCDVPTMQTAIGAAAKTGRLILPGRVAHRLRQPISEQIMALPVDAPFPVVPPQQIEQSVRPVGFLHVIRRDSYDAVNGYDERFRGWGGEDTAFLGACDTILGHRLRLNGSLWSLWHPRPRENGRRVWAGQTDRNMTLLRHYSGARGKPEVMRRLVDRG